MIGSKKGYGLWITAERDAALREFTPKILFRHVFKRICALPGPPPPSIEAVRHRAHKVLGLHGSDRHAKPKTAAPPPPPPPPPPAPVPSRRKVDWSKVDFRSAVTLPQLQRIAAEWGIRVRDWEDMPAVNAHAERIGHPGYKRSFAKR